MSHPQVKTTTELVWAICHPDSALRLRPDPTAAEALQITASALLALMHLSEIGYTEPVARMIGRLYGLTQTQREQMAVALARIGADKLLRAIRRYAEMIQFHSSGPALSESEAVALAESKALQWRLLNSVIDAAHELPDKILSWLVATNLFGNRSMNHGTPDRGHDAGDAALTIQADTVRQSLPHCSGQCDRPEELAFHESCDFGLAAWVAAEGDGNLPLLGIELSEGSRFWWLEPFDDSDCLLIEAGQDEQAPDFRLVVSPRSKASFLAWWTRIGEDVNVTYLAAPGHNDPKTVLWWLKHGNRFDGLQAWSLALGWAYTHRWGGGADEHYARFCAEDPTCLQRVRQFALGMRREGWYVPIDANES